MLYSLIPQDGIRAIVSQLQAQGASEAQIRDTVQQATEYYQQRKYVFRHSPVGPASRKDIQRNSLSMRSQKPQ